MQERVLGILAGGGPAPGINGVIGAATIHAINEGFKVIGIFDGYSGLMGKTPLETVELGIRDVSRIHYLGGIILRTDRANPVKEDKIEKVIENLQTLGINYLLTIGGDDTASVAGAIAARTDIKVIHAPKTIDNDLPLPPGIPTFGFSTARQLGGELAKNIMADAYAAKRWFFIETMGRKAGHLALGIGKAAGVPLILIPEAIPKNTDIHHVVDIIVGSIIKRLSEKRPDGVVIYTEGLPEKLDSGVVEKLIGKIPRDTHGHPRWSEVDFQSALKNLVLKRLRELGIDKFPITNERIGYSLRCADPIPYDQELTRDLGLSAVELLVAGKTNCMVSIQREQVVPVPFEDMIDPESGKAIVRRVNIKAKPYQVALGLMIRLLPEDFENDTIKKIAQVTNLSPEEFKKQFQPISTALL